MRPEQVARKEAKPSDDFRAHLKKPRRVRGLREHLERLRDERTTRKLNAFYPAESDDNEAFLSAAAAIVLARP